jgi:hypothetical protein
MLAVAKRALHIDRKRHPTPSCGELSLYRGENREPARITSELDPRPGIREQSQALLAARNRLWIAAASIVAGQG